MIFLIPFLALLLFSSIFFLLSNYYKRLDIADIAWGLGFIIVGWSSFAIGQFSTTNLLLNILVTLWGVRLVIHLLLRNKNREEDFRYKKLKKNWNRFKLIQTFLKVFLLQGFFLYIIAIPLIWSSIYPTNLSPIAWGIGLPLWLSGFFIESFADYQLLSFKKESKNKGKLCRVGLWNYSRHPNFLGEILQWWAVWLIVVNLPYGIFLVISPLLISFLIIKVSGIPPLEKRMEKSEKFKNYKREVPKLFPFSIFISLIYFIYFFIAIYFGPRDYLFLVTSAFLLALFSMLFLLYVKNRKSLSIAIPIMLYSTLIGIIKQYGLILTGALIYYPSSYFPPFWILSLYPLFALLLNESLNFLNYSYLLSFFVGGLGGLLVTDWGVYFDAVLILGMPGYFFLFLSWGLYFLLLTFLNRKLLSLQEKYANPLNLKKEVIVFFDQGCPICFGEMKRLKKRKQSGNVIYKSLDQKTQNLNFSYEEGMKSLHAIEGKRILKGIDALSALYARTNLTIIAILLQAPILRPIFKFLYSVWAKIRPRKRGQLDP